jgi:hypothetical protein
MGNAEPRHACRSRQRCSVPTVRQARGARFGHSVQVSGGPFEPEPAYWYSADDRRRQLCRLGAACERLAVLHEREAADVAGVYEAISEEANRLVSATPGQKVLTALGSWLPGRPAWLDPKFHEFQMPRSDWQDEVAQLRDEAEAASLELRSLATYDRP